MNRLLLYVAGIGGAILSLASCKSNAKQVATTGLTDIDTVVVDIVNDWSELRYNPMTVAEANKDWADFSATGNMTIEAGSKIKSGVQLRMIKGKSVSFSIRPFLGIEMGKMLIEVDSVTIVDKYHGCFMKESIGKFLGLGITVDALQNLLLARPFDLQTGAVCPDNSNLFHVSACYDENMWVLLPKETPDAFTYFFDMMGNNIREFTIDLKNGKLYSLVFKSYKETDKGHFATEIQAEMAFAGTPVTFILDLDKGIRWDSGLTDTINIPKGARRLSFDDIIHSLTKQ